jgi:hypothetical protein
MEHECSVPVAENHRSHSCVMIITSIESEKDEALRPGVQQNDCRVFCLDLDGEWRETPSGAAARAVPMAERNSFVVLS